ncbi:unnamed protein product, partial [Hapterophycus canaliculatus]
MSEQELLSQSCPFTPDIGISAAWPIQEATTEEFVRRLHGEHAEQERRLQAKRLRKAPQNSVDPATGRPLFSPLINGPAAGQRGWRGRRRRRPAWGPETYPDRGTRGGWFFPRRTTTATAVATAQPRRSPRGGLRSGSDGYNEADEYDEYDEYDDKSIHASLWERGLELERRREAGARSREEAREARASTGHVSARSAELVRAMRVRSLVQTYRTLLASVEYARLPEGLDYDEAMESITAKINAIFDNDNDAWQEMSLEV